MSLQTLRKDLNKYELDRRVIVPKIARLLPFEELSSLFGELVVSPYYVDNITANLDDKTTLNIIYTSRDYYYSVGDMKFSIITPEETYTVTFPYTRYKRYPPEDTLQLSYFYTTLEPYKEVLEDKIEEGFRKALGLDKLIKKEN